MLRPADDVRLTFAPAFGEQGWMVLELEDEDISLRWISQTEFRCILLSSSRAPYRVAEVNESVIWMFEETYFWDDNGLTPDEVQRQIARRLPAA